jgi:pyridoxamine 5'-phosphate oxidase
MPNLRKEDFSPDPLIQFKLWYEEAKGSDINFPNAMTLATATGSGIPSARIVLLRHFDRRGFVFFTNYDSRKGQELEANPAAALVFYWSPLGRQVRITGRVAKVSQKESDDYFQGRPRGSQLGVWASAQSQVIPNRNKLIDHVNELENRYRTGHIPRPTNWGGFRVIPGAIEFWQDQPDRLHDRLQYTRGENSDWTIARLAP